MSVTETPLRSVDRLHADLAVREAAELVSRYVESNPGMGAGRLVQAVGGLDEMNVWRAKRLLMAHGYMENRQEGGASHRYFSTRPYRLGTDPDAEHRPVLTDRLEALIPQVVEPLVEHGRVVLLLEHGIVRIEADA